MMMLRRSQQYRYDVEVSSVVARRITMFYRAVLFIGRFARAEYDDVSQLQSGKRVCYDTSAYSQSIDVLSLSDDR